MKSRQILRKKRHLRARHKVMGTAQRPRLSIFRSLRHLYVQLIDDESGKTLLAMSDYTLEKKSDALANAKMIGQEIAKMAKSKKITEIIFDKSGFSYHGQVKAVAEGARDGGLKF